MVIDISALLAILYLEEEADGMARVIAEDPRRLVCTFSVLEAGIVVEARSGETAGRELDLLLHRIRAEVIPLTDSHSEVARAAWRRYGKSRHPAGLNIGDCCVYAVAKIAAQPLLCKGDDFPKTDLATVAY